MAKTEAELMKQRQDILAEIKRRGGQANAPGFALRLDEVDAQLKGIRGGANPAVPAATAPKLGKLNNNINNVTTAISNEQKIQDYSAGRNFNYGNPNTTNPYGGVTNTLNPDGTVSREEFLNSGEQRILDADRALGGMARDIASQRLGSGTYAAEFNPNLTARTSTGDLAADRARIEDAVYKGLTRNTERNYTNDRRSTEQLAANRGIDINSQEYRDNYATPLNERYDAERANAANQAVVTGGQEYQRNVDIGEQFRTNDYNTQAGVRATNLGEISGLGNYGPGVRNPNLPGYQAPNYQLPSSTDVYSVLKNLGLNKRQLDLAFAQLNKGGGGGAAPAPADPFNNSLPPGA